ncbi:MAG TPA: [protein-PII] uridylyltransferase [Mycobacteriales bacterium]|jgi:[protein-PII] uridylyltransferase|nr:[protein-PII] uridylyltransferase [Mycobacteriales bacterium]
MSEEVPEAAALRDAHAAALACPGLVGPALREALTEAANDWLRERLGDATDVALVAVGSLGRRELAAGSDLDLLLLYRDRLRGSVSELADSLWYPIWDSGIGLDHSVRTVGEAVSVAREDLKAVLGMLDARHVAGDPALTAELRETVFADWRRLSSRRLPELVASVRSRAERWGELAFLVEPDLKESRGGIRDVQAMHALAAAWVVDAPAEPVRAAYSWLLDVRGELHRRSSRATDRLVQQEQAPITAALGAGEPDELMRRLYEAGRTIEFATDHACRRAEAASRPPGRWRRSRGPTRQPLAEGVVEQDGEVHLARDAAPATDPGLVLRVAAAAATAGLPLGMHTLDRLATESAAMPEPWPADARNALVATLGAGRPAIVVLEALDQAGLLVRLMPEWERVRCRPQHNTVHRFTVDRHLVEAAVEASALTRRVSRPDLLLLGALLHDLGKGYPGDHTAAGVEVVPPVARRMGLTESDVDSVTALVRHHLLLPETATRRDLDDPATVAAVAAAVGDRDSLDLLHALTIADAAATGKGAWGEWKAGLVAELVARTHAALAGRPAEPANPLDEGQRALVRAGELAVALDGSQLTIVAPDAPDLLWRWAGIVSLHRLRVRSASALTTSSDSGAPMAVTSFDVVPQFGTMPDLDALRSDVRRAADGGFPLEARLAERERAYAGTLPSRTAPPLVLWADDDASDVASVVEVRAHDVIGLLYRLTRALSTAGLTLRSARIQTLGAEVVDAFYVVDVDGGRVVDAGRREAVTGLLLRACHAGGPNYA